MAELLYGRSQRRGALLYIVVAVAVILFGSHYFASTFIDYEWWSELGQRNTWWNLLLYGTVPVVVATVLLLSVFWIAFQAGIRRERESSRFTTFNQKFIKWGALVVLLLLASLVASATVDNWTVVRFLGGSGLSLTAGEFVDPIFKLPLHFYFFQLPFYKLLLHLVLTGSILTLIVYWLAAHAQAFTRQLPNFRSATSFEFEGISLREAFDSFFARLVLSVLLCGMAVKFFFSRYDLLLEDHGAFLVGLNWAADHLVLPLQWLMIAGALIAAGCVIANRSKWALVLLLVLPVRYILPGVVEALYVRPNELNLEKPYIHDHIEATRSAYGLNRKVKETSLEAQSEIQIDYGKHKALLDNVRLWDWRAFHDTISQIQPLRPYSYIDTDVDRYTIDGQLRQVLVAPRELDIRQLGEARGRWVNPNLIYTHGYGIVMAEANRITPDGLPLLFIKNAPPEVTTPTLKLTRPEIYYGEVSHEPVFVDTAQQEFNFPSGSQSVYTNYKGVGGLDVSSLFTKLMASVLYADPNIILTSYLQNGSRMMIHRPILERLRTLAGFITWDTDPYLVLTDAGQLVWITDGYMTSDAHPYSREIGLSGDRSINYIRNSVKATIDAYTGQVSFYIFDPEDVLIQAYARLFPTLFRPASAMPPDLRRHARYPETLFSAQAEMYRTFHMREPEAFYNRADLWDIAKTTSRQGEPAATVSPTYVVATLPGAPKAEFMLITPFTPANKDNLIAYMSARCDGDNLGELVFEQLSKQNIVFGPMQIDARINQDQNISKDLSLWNQQGSQVLRGQTLVLPIENSFLYVEPIYIQASQGSMPQLKKVAVAMGNRLAYADTYEQALSQLIQSLGSPAPAIEQITQIGQPSAASVQTSATTQPISADAVRTLGQIKDHLTRYRQLSAQGKWAEAGKELDAIQGLVQK